MNKHSKHRNGGRRQMNISAQCCCYAEAITNHHHREDIPHRRCGMERLGQAFSKCRMKRGCTKEGNQILVRNRKRNSRPGKNVQAPLLLIDHCSHACEKLVRYNFESLQIYTCVRSSAAWHLQFRCCMDAGVIVFSREQANDFRKAKCKSFLQFS